ncbi:MULTISPECIES: hypothetical protein [unclassified Cryobacterium]|uniref:hypothetical protein n=1 Tax=unclassified Cryobacterium TaxID=2649013 RepID=UPI002AB4DA03|nr:MULTISPECIES: hypothetical protein [unclassified Cryobacterium]MDY7544392.1 hypothetical protein [Cryobacterium sp. 5B3]MEA9998793.1 hypothetical protein [Cryobacterium sp. RTS3]MEB0268014.1 hypothetical protein [Cryobacterium sp. 10I5]MEB0274168.1 hypothetical protein [Cryobacterium sp. 5B3]
MTIRITTTSTKIGYVTSSCVVVILGSALTIGLPLPVASVVTGALALVLVAFATRTFRGEGEPVEQRRPWWKMTAHRTSGFVFTLLFGAQAIYLLIAVISRPESGLLIVPLITNAVIAAMFAFSSMRLGVTARAIASNKQ